MTPIMTARSRDVLESSLEVEHPFIFFCVIPCDMTACPLSEVVDDLKNLMNSNPAVWILLEKRFPLKTRRKDLQRKELASMIESTLNELIAKWLEATQPAAFQDYLVNAQSNQLLIPPVADKGYNNIGCFTSIAS